MILIEHDKLENICKINQDAKMEDVVYDGVKFKVIRNFLANPEEYINLIQKFPATRDHTYSPGFRQDIPPWAAKFITLYIQEYVGNWIPARVSCNIYSGNMLMRQHSNLPHSDPFYGIWNLWLNKKCLGGTAFWAYKNKLHVSELSEEEHNHLFDKPLNGSGYEKWKNFKGDKDWKMTCIAPMEYNSLLFYNGGFFHSPWIQENWYLDEYRYSMVGMGSFENV
jgi:hypothetical protein